MKTGFYLYMDKKINGFRVFYGPRKEDVIETLIVNRRMTIAQRPSVLIIEDDAQGPEQIRAYTSAIALFTHAKKRWDFITTDRSLRKFVHGGRIDWTLAQPLIEQVYDSYIKPFRKQWPKLPENLHLPTRKA